MGWPSRFFFFFQAEDGIRDYKVTGVQTCALPIYPLRIRGRATGWVAACSKLGGLTAQGVSVVAGVPPFAAAILTIAVPAVGSTILIALFGRESRGRSLDRKSTRLNSSHLVISYAVFCLKKK